MQLGECIVARTLRLHRHTFFCGQRACRLSMWPRSHREHTRTEPFKYKIYFLIARSKMNSRIWCGGCRQSLRSFTTSIPHFTVYFIYFVFSSTQHTRTHVQRVREKKDTEILNAYYVFIIEATGCVYKIHTHFPLRISLLELK